MIGALIIEAEIKKSWKKNWNIPKGLPDFVSVRICPIERFAENLHLSRSLAFGNGQKEASACQDRYPGKSLAVWSSKIL